MASEQPEEPTIDEDTQAAVAAENALIAEVTKDAALRHLQSRVVDLRVQLGRAEAKLAAKEGK